jgi:hypothetical protein
MNEVVKAEKTPKGLSSKLEANLQFTKIAADVATWSPEAVVNGLSVSCTSITALIYRQGLVLQRAHEMEVWKASPDGVAYSDFYDLAWRKCGLKPQTVKQRIQYSQQVLHVAQLDPELNNRLLAFGQSKTARLFQLYYMRHGKDEPLDIVKFKTLLAEIEALSMSELAAIIDAEKPIKTITYDGDDEDGGSIAVSDASSGGKVLKVFFDSDEDVEAFKRVHSALSEAGGATSMGATISLLTANYLATNNLASAEYVMADLLRMAKLIGGKLGVELAVKVKDDSGQVHYLSPDELTEDIAALQPGDDDEDLEDLSKEAVTVFDPTAKPVKSAKPVKNSSTEAEVVSEPQAPKPKKTAKPKKTEVTVITDENFGEEALDF